MNVQREMTTAQKIWTTQFEHQTLAEPKCHLKRTRMKMKMMQLMTMQHKQESKWHWHKQCQEMMGDIPQHHLPPMQWERAMCQPMPWSQQQCQHDHNRRQWCKWWSRWCITTTIKTHLHTTLFCWRQNSQGRFRHQVLSNWQNDHWLKEWTFQHTKFCHFRKAIVSLLTSWRSCDFCFHLCIKCQHNVSMHHQLNNSSALETSFCKSNQIKQKSKSWQDHRPMLNQKSTEQTPQTCGQTPNQCQLKSSTQHSQTLNNWHKHSIKNKNQRNTVD